MPPVLRKIDIGTGNPSLSTDNATDSICPYGWQLAEDDTTSKKSFSNLINTYIRRSSNTTDLENADIGLLALSFLRSGYYYYDSGALNGRGTYGYYWSAQSYTSGTTLGAYSLHFLSTYVYPQNGNNRGNGFAVRCLAC